MRWEWPAPPQPEAINAHRDRGPNQPSTSSHGSDLPLVAGTSSRRPEYRTLRSAQRGSLLGLGLTAPPAEQEEEDEARGHGQRRDHGQDDRDRRVA